MRSDLSDGNREPENDLGAMTANIHAFVDFLDDRTPPLFVAESISAILRTEPPVLFGTQRAADLVATWAERRAEPSGRGVGELMLNATRKIIEAYRANTLTGFDPKAFYRAFVLALTARCPAAERDGFQSGLRSLQDSLPKRWAHRTTAEFDQTDTVEIRGQRMRHEQAVAELVRRLEALLPMPDGEFDETMADLDRVFVSRVGVPVRQTLIRLGCAGAAIFNTAQVRRASRVFAFVAVLFDRLQFSYAEREDIRGTTRGAVLDERILSKWVGDPKLHDEVAPVVRYFGDLDPAPAIDRLEVEPSRDRRRLLLNLVEIHGASALPLILERLDPGRTGETSWYLPRNLIYLLSRIAPPDAPTRRKVVELLTPYLTSPVPQLRSAALAALKRTGGRDIVPRIAKVLDPTCYPLPLRDEALRALERHLAQALELLAVLDLESGVAVVAEFATGGRGAEFGLGRALRDAAIAAIAARPGPLPRRAVLTIVGHLRQQSERRVKLVVGNLSLGVDLVGCRRLMRLIADSAEPEAVAVLETPFLRRLAQKGTGELLQVTAVDV